MPARQSLSIKSELLRDFVNSSGVLRPAIQQRPRSKQVLADMARLLGPRQQRWCLDMLLQRGEQLGRGGDAVRPVKERLLVARAFQVTRQRVVVFGW